MEVPCILCGSNEMDKLIFGKVKKEDNNVAHYNCLILSLRRYRPNEFRIVDTESYLRNEISAEAMRCSATMCFYCHRLGANIMCCEGGCLRSFHTKCGVDNSAIYQYSVFRAFCHQHVPETPNRPDPEEVCLICLAPLVPEGETFNRAIVLQSPCCYNGWYHRPCMQLHANSELEFRCPMCLDSEKFLAVTLSGIAIPNKRFFLPLLPLPGTLFPSI